MRRSFGASGDYDPGLPLSKERVTSVHMDSGVRERLRKELDRIAPGRVRSYAVDMWRHALDCADGKTRYEENHFALPYVPVGPEAFGVRLDASSNVIDIGCLGGYGMFDFQRTRRAVGLEIPRMVGVDVDQDSITMAMRLAPIWAGDRASFRTADCESLPFPDATFDLVVARLVLPYTNVDRALGQIRRVLRHEGFALLQSHALSYYVHQLLSHLKSPKLTVHFAERTSYLARPIVERVCRVVRGTRPDCGADAVEAAVGRTLLTRMCRKLGLVPLWHGGDEYRPLTLFRAAAPHNRR